MFTMKGILERRGFRHGEHYLEVPTRQVFGENELEIFAHRKKAFKNALRSAGALASAGIVFSFGPRPLQIAAIPIILLGSGRAIHHIFKMWESFIAEMVANERFPQIHSKLSDYGKGIQLDGGRVRGAAFTIGGDKIFFLNKRARDHLKSRKWRWTNTSFSFDE